MDDHSAGVSTVCFVPRIVGLDAIRTGVTDPASHIYWYELDAEHGDDLPVARLCEVAGLGGLPSDELFASEELQGCGFLVEVDRGVSPDLWIGLAQDFGRLRATSNGGAQPPLVSVLAESVPAERAGRGNAGVRSHYWWGAVTRLDVLVHLSELFGDDIDDVLLSELAELAGFDLALADRLYSEEVADPAAAMAVLRGWAELHEMEKLDPVMSTEIPGVNPGRFTAPWIRGELDSLDGRVHRSVAATNSSPGAVDPVRRALWVGQVRSLLPRLEFWKTNAVSAIEEAGVQLNDRDDLEVRDVARIAWRSRRALPRGLPPAVEWLRQARNKLAHLQLVGSDDRKKGARLLKRAGLL